MNKKKIMWVISGGIMVILLIFVGIFFKLENAIENMDKDIKDNVDDTNEVNNNVDIFPVKDGRMIKFYKTVEGFYNVYAYENEEVLSTYECVNEECGYCNTYTVCSGSQLKNTLGKITLFDYNINEVSSSQDGSFNPCKLILFDALNGKKISEYDDIVSSYSLDSDYGINASTKYIILVNKNNLTSIVDLSGNYIKNYSNKEYVISSYEGKFISKSSYLVSSDMIVTINNNKYGIEKISEDKLLIDYKFDEIMLSDIVNYESVDLYSSKYFKARIGDKWSLYSFDTGNKVIDNDFDRIYLLDDNTIVIYNDGYISFIDYEGNKIIDDKIKVSNLFANLPSIPEGIKFTIESEVVKISINEGTNYDDYVSSSYEYNLSTKKLEKIS